MRQIIHNVALNRWKNSYSVSPVINEELDFGSFKDGAPAVGDRRPPAAARVLWAVSYHSLGSGIAGLGTWHAGQPAAQPQSSALGLGLPCGSWAPKGSVQPEGTYFTPPERDTLVGLPSRTSSCPSEEDPCKPHAAGCETLAVDTTPIVFPPAVLALLPCDGSYSSPIHTPNTPLVLSIPTAGRDSQGLVSRP